jgi:glycosyltransferase involved in cell wall biosynthesis
MKKVLIITYYWPPKGGVGVQRWLKLSKYLSKYNYQLIIYTPSNGVYPLEDTSLLDDISKDIVVIRRKIFEPQKIVSLLKNNHIKSDVLIKKSHNLLDRILIWLRSNIFIPDSRSCWISPSIKFLSNYLKDNPVDIIVSTGPPHSMHMIALSLRKKNNIKWIADFRDPWTGIEYFDKLPFLSWVKKKHHKLEKEVLVNSDLVLTVSPSWAKQFNNLGAKKTSILTNGYDSDDYKNLVNKIESTRFTIGHFGLYNELRNHTFFWDTINIISKKNLDFFNNLNFLFAGEIY